MLKSFSVKNFKQFKSLTMDFSDVRDYGFSKDCLTKHKHPLIKTAIVYGPNASGKSNLGFAIFDIVYHLVDRVLQHDAYDYYLNADHPTEAAEFSYTFVFGRNLIEYSYTKQNPTKLLSEKLLINDKHIFSWDWNSGETVPDLSGLKNCNLNSLNFVYWNYRIPLLRYIANNSVLDEKSPIRQLMDFVGSMLWFRRVDKSNNFMGLQSNVEKIDDFIIQKNLTEEFERFLNENQVDEKIEVRKTPDGRGNLYFKHQRPIPFFETASSGTLALAVYFYWLHYVEKASFLFMDEFDAFYHFEIARDIVEQAKKFKCQTVLTTHNTGLLNHNLVRPDVCFIMDKGVLKSFANMTNRELRQGNNLEKLFISGEFNG